MQGARPRNPLCSPLQWHSPQTHRDETLEILSQTPNTSGGFETRHSNILVH